VYLAMRFEPLVVGLSHACGLVAEGEAFCWCSDVRGELGIGRAAEDGVAVPSRIGRCFCRHQRSLGILHSCGITRERRPYCRVRDESVTWARATSGSAVCQRR
jgi:hypothetical protein